MRRLVLDASVALAWFIDHPVPAYALRVEQVLADGGRLSFLLFGTLKVANGFVAAERRGVISAGDTMQALHKLELLLIQSIESIPAPISLRRVLASARQFRLTVYDACYLELARDMQLPLATLDRQLANAANQDGILLR